MTSHDLLELISTQRLDQLNQPKAISREKKTRPRSNPIFDQLAWTSCPKDALLRVTGIITVVFLENICICMWLYIHMYVYLYMHIYIHICMYIYICNNCIHVQVTVHIIYTVCSMHISTNAYDFK